MAKKTSNSTAKSKVGAKRKASKVPHVVLLAACDAISRDPNSKKITLYGLFDRWRLHNIPSQIPLWVYLKLADGVGKHNVEVRLVGPGKKRNKENESNFGLDFGATELAEIAFQTIVQVPSAGNYFVEVYVGKKRIGGPFKITAEDCTNGQQKS